MDKNNRGFTLIELLVVIAIIGVLSSIVLASLNTARGKGADAAIKGNLAGLRVQAEMVYDGNGCYADGVATGSGCAEAAFAGNPSDYICAATADTIFDEPTVESAILSAAKAFAGSSATIATAKCISSAKQTAWAIAVPLKSSGADKWWCVDSTGASRQVTKTGTGSSLFVTLTSACAAS